MQAMRPAFATLDFRWPIEIKSEQIQPDFTELSQGQEISRISRIHIENLIWLKRYCVLVPNRWQSWIEFPF